MAAFPAQLTLSALVMGGVVTGLFFLGQAKKDALPSVSSQVMTGALPTEPVSPASARSLLPARSWLVVDFDGRLTGASPFSNSAAGCSDVPPPPRVGLAIGASDGTSSGSAGPTTLTSGGAVLLLASPAVSPEFWRCVRAEVLAAGGRILSAGADEEALESPSGVLVHSGQRLLFASDRKLLQELSDLARGRAQSAASTAPHPALEKTLPTPPASSGATDAPLLATLHLPADWLADLGPEAQRTPLRHLQAGALRADADGGATGALECAQPGCDELAAFLLRARSDLGAMLPPALGEATARSWTADVRAVSPTRGLIVLRWVPQGVTFADWAGGLWRHLSGQSR